MKFCSKCGTQLPEGSRFCDSCGAAIPQEYAPIPQASASVDLNAVKETAQKVFRDISGDNIQQPQPQPEYTRYPHPYHKLGGFLAFIAYAQLVGIGLMVFAFVVGLAATLRYWEFLGAIAGISLLVQFAGYGVACFFCAKFSSMLRKKDPKFLRFYELTMLTMCAISLAVLGFSGFRSFSMEMLQSLLSAVLGFLIWTTYFRKSVRVRTYMGSDAYLKYSIFFKNATAPEPADKVPQPVPPMATGFPAPPAANGYSPPPTASGFPAAPPYAPAGNPCAACGAALSQEAQFCTKCGAKNQ